MVMYMASIRVSFSIRGVQIYRSSSTSCQLHCRIYTSVLHGSMKCILSTCMCQNFVHVCPLFCGPAVSYFCSKISLWSSICIHIAVVLLLRFCTCAPCHNENTVITDLVDTWLSRVPKVFKCLASLVMTTFLLWWMHRWPFDPQCCQTVDVSFLFRCWPREYRVLQWAHNRPNQTLECLKMFQCLAMSVLTVFPL